MVLRGRTTGIEPANGGTTNHCLNHLATLAMPLEIVADEGGLWITCDESHIEQGLG